MEEIIHTPKEEFLSVFCVDTIQIKARVTFDECLYRGVHVTFWSEETEESAKILDDVFNILLEEVMKMRKRERDGEAPKLIASIIEKNHGQYNNQKN